jgi:hypothetical protein
LQSPPDLQLAEGFKPPESAVGASAGKEKYGMTDYCTEAISGGNPDEGIVCTLFEGDYHFGLAALINSLVRNGFQGCIAVGYRGALPPWIDQLKPINGAAAAGSVGYEICPGVRTEFIPLDTAVHFTNLKPEFMRQMIRERKDCKYIWYFDPDIVVRCAWSFYVHWVRHGVALCEDVNGSLPENHPLRYRWMELVSPAGLKSPQPLSKYYNGGFIGMPTSCSGFLDLWQDVTRIAESVGFDVRGFGTGDRTNPFFRADQDTLNITAMFTKHPLTTIGARGDGVPSGKADHVPRRGAKALERLIVAQGVSRRGTKRSREVFL